MKKIKNNPYDFLEKEGINPEQLSKSAIEGLALFDDAAADIEQLGKDVSDDLIASADAIGLEVTELLKAEVKKVKGVLQEELDSQISEEKRQQLSTKTLEEARLNMKRVEDCEKLLKEAASNYRKAKKEAGLLPQKSKPTITKKLSNGISKLLRSVTYNNKKVKDDQKKLAALEKEAKVFVNKVKVILGLTSVKGIEQAIQKEIKKFTDPLEEKESNNVT